VPVVNFYGDRKVAPEALPGVRKQAVENDVSSGAALDEAIARKDESIAGLGGAAVGVAATALTDIARAQKQEKDRADQIAVFNANNQLLQWKNRRLFTDDNAAMGVKGVAAMPLPEQVGDEFKTYADTLATSMSTPKQKEAFARLSLEHQTDLDYKLRSHVFNEMQTYEGNVLQATLDNNTDDAIRNATNPRNVGMAVGNIVTAIQASGPRLGLPPEMIADKIAAAKSRVFTGVIGSLVDQGQQKTAQIYFDEVKSELKGPAIEHIEKALNEGRVKKDSQAAADQILAAGGTLSEQRAKAKAIDDPAVRDAVEARLEHENAVNERATREAQEAKLKGVYDTLDQTHDVRNIPPTVWASMTGSERTSAMEYATRLAKGVKVETDFPTYYSLMQKAAQQPEQFATESLLKYRASIGDTELKQLTEMQNAIVKGEHAKAEAAGLAGWRTNEQILTDSLAQYGIRAGGKDQTPEEKNAIAELRRRLDRDMAAQEQLTGKKPTNVDRQNALDNILKVSKTTPGSWWGLNPFSSSPLHDKTTRVIDIPLVDRQQIESALRAKGRPVDDATVLSVYVAAHK
jgi:hypothetical protein